MKTKNIIVLFCLFVSTYSFAQNYKIVYINGIQNTAPKAAETTFAINRYLASPINHPPGKTFAVTNIWNPIGWYGTEDGFDSLQDNKELYLLKTAEEDYVENFRQIIRPHNLPQEPFGKAIAQRVATYADVTRRLNNNNLETDIPNDAMQGTQAALNSLYKQFVDNKTENTIVIAHSQGNLLANLMWAKVMSQSSVSDAEKNNLRIINVANTGLISPNNLNYTHAGDRAIYTSLPLLGLSWERATTGCQNNGARARCLFKFDSPRFSAVTGTGIGVDHNFQEVYLADSTNAQMPLLDINQGINFTIGAQRPIDRFEDFVYTAAESMEVDAKWQCPETGNVGEKLTCTLVGKGISQVSVSSAPACDWQEESPVTSVNRYVNQNKVNGRNGNEKTGNWQNLGIYTVNNTSKVSLFADSTGKVIADALRLIPVDSSAQYNPPVDAPNTINLTSENSIRSGQWNIMWEPDGVTKYSGQLHIEKVVNFH